MPAMKPTPDVIAEARKQLQALQDSKKVLREKYNAEPKVPMYLSPMYRAYFGNSMRVSVNGVYIYLKVDGGTYMVPQTFADEITRRRMSIDNMLTKQNRMADIQNNHENAPGALKLF